MSAPISIGQRFGRLVVQERAPSTKGSGPRWLCRCDCGGQTITRERRLKAGEVISCGCSRKQLIDLAWKRFGRLVAIEQAGNDPIGRAVWRCKCECGNEPEVLGYHLRSGHTQSCGCNQPARLHYGKSAPRLTCSEKFESAEQRAIRAAIQAGKVIRIPNGSWPDEGRLYERNRSAQTRGSARGGRTGAMLRRMAAAGGAR